MARRGRNGIGRRRGRILDRAPRQRNDIVLGVDVFQRIASGGDIVRRPLMTGPLSKHTAQTQEDEHREAKKDDGSDFHVASVRLSIAGSAGPVLLSI